MNLIYRTAGSWGPGKGANLEDYEVDENFYELWTRIEDFLDGTDNGAVGISNILVSGTQMTIILENSDELGPYTLPVASLEWTAGFWPGDTIPSSTLVFQHVFTDTHTLAVNMAGSRVLFTAPPAGTDSVVFSVRHYDASEDTETEIGTIEVDASGVVVLTAASAVVFDEGDGLRVYTPADMDAAMADVSFNFRTSFYPYNDGTV